jgi:hypothetical protein
MYFAGAHTCSSSTLCDCFVAPLSYIAFQAAPFLYEDRVMLFVDLLGYVYPLAEVVRLPPLTHNQTRCFNIEVVGVLIVLFHICISWLFCSL